MYADKALKARYFSFFSSS